mgnify:CR=1 FL=1
MKNNKTFNLIKLFIIIISIIGVIVIFGGVIYTLSNPEFIGEFFGKIVKSFNSFN